MRAHRVAAWLLWWLGWFWLWMLLVADWSRIELIAGACAAAVAATFTEAARAAARVHLQVPLDVLRAGVSVPFVIFADFGILTYVLARSLMRRQAISGRYLARPFDPGPKTTPAGTARRAWTIYLSGFSPNAYLVDIDVDARLVLLHDLVPWRKSEEPA
ncbi:MAG: hypothetical protein ACTHNU_01090 [Gaiellales bacterium]|jgi:hypothetical protein